ncbi:MAG: hypothetical protein P1U36_07445 [Legionellaceae bacterium]|nr:hypothetical protein [Legionellaceae bacterium]
MDIVRNQYLLALLGVVAPIVGPLLAILIAYPIYKKQVRWDNKFTILKESLSSLEWLRYISHQHSLSDEHTFKIVTNNGSSLEDLNKSLQESIRSLSQVRFLYDDQVEKLIDDFEKKIASIYYDFYWECQRNLPTYDKAQDSLEYDRLYCKKSDEIYSATRAIIKSLKERINRT